MINTGQEIVLLQLPLRWTTLASSTMTGVIASKKKCAHTLDSSFACSEAAISMVYSSIWKKKKKKKKKKNGLELTK